MSDVGSYWNMRYIYPKLMEKHKELEKAGRLCKCYKILAPILTIEVNIKQAPNESFEEIEKLILSLIDAGVNEKQEISELTGISVNYIESIISLLVTQKLLTEDGKFLTDNGQISLQTGEKYINIIEKKRFQVNGITLNIMPKKFTIYGKELLKMQQVKEYEFGKNPTYEMLQVIEDNTWEDIEKNIKQYVQILNDLSSNNIQDISLGGVIDSCYTYFFLLEFEFLQQPIIVAKSFEFINNKVEFYYEPL